MLSDPLVYLAAVPAILIAGISKGGFGGGLGFAAVPLLALVIDPRLAASILLPILCLMDLSGTWHYWRRWNWPSLRVLLAGALAGIGLGSATFGLVDENLIRLLIGLIALIFTLHGLRDWLRRRRGTGQDPDGTDVSSAPRPGGLRGAFWGGVAGFTSFVAHAGGPPVTVYLVPQKLPRTEFQATTVMFFLVVNYVKLVPYSLLGQFTRESLLTALVLAPLAPASMALGVWLHKRVSDAAFYRLVYVFLVLTGAKLVYDGATGLLG